MFDLNTYFHDYQKAWLACDAPLAIGEKSRRIGWTYASAFRAVERRLRLGTDLYYTSADLSSAREFIEDCQLFARVAKVVADDLGMQAIDESGLQAFVLRFDNGSKIVAGSSNPKFFRGKGGDVDADEFAFHENPRELFKAMHATAMVLGHQIRIWSTHNGEGSYYATLIKDAREGRLDAVVQTVTILDAVGQGIVERIRGLPARDDAAREAWLKNLRATIPDQDAWNQEYMCRPSSEQAALLSYDLIGKCEASDLKLIDDTGELPAEGGPVYAGFDVGRKHDLSCLWALERIGDVYTTRIVLQMKNMTFSSQGELLARFLGNRRVKRLCIDSTGLGMEMAERLIQRFNRFRVEAVHFTAPVKSELAMPLRRLFEDRLIRIPARADVREGLHKVRKIVTAANNIRLDATSDGAGHADEFWALALAYHAADDIKRPLPRPTSKPAGW